MSLSVFQHEYESYVSSMAAHYGEPLGFVYLGQLAKLLDAARLDERIAHDDLVAMLGAALEKGYDAVGRTFSAWLWHSQDNTKEDPKCVKC